MNQNPQPAQTAESAQLETLPKIIKMKFSTILTALAAGIAMAAPAPEADKAPDALAPQACLPASCQSFGVSSLLKIRNRCLPHH